LLLKYRFYKRKLRPIKLFNKKKSKIINLNKKFFKTLFNLPFHDFHYENHNFYKLRNFFKNKFHSSNNFYDLNKLYLLKKLFNFNKKFLKINVFNFKFFFLNFYNYKSKNNFLFSNLFSNFFYLSFFSNFTTNFGFFYLYYLNNTSFLIKSNHFNFLNVLLLNKDFKFRNNFFFKNHNRLFFKNFSPNFSNKFINKNKNKNFIKFLNLFKIKDLLLTRRLGLNKINTNLHPLFMLLFSTFHYKNLFIKKIKTRNLEIFKLTKGD
jgi:hypothetical protein